MRKLLLVSLVLFIVCHLVGLEMETKGVKGGLNIATIGGDDVDDADSKLGLAIGGFATYKINEKYSLQPEVYFSMKGFTMEYSESEDYYNKYSEDETVNLNYLEIPVLGVMNLPVESNLQPKVFLGPAIGINLSATYESDWEGTQDDEYGDSYTYSGSSDGDLEDVNTIEFGLVLGGSVEYNQLVFDLRYNMGLTDIGDWENSLKNRVFSILVGYKF